MTLKGYSSGNINSVAYSPDGKTLASGSSDKTIKLWTTNLPPTAIGLSNSTVAENSAVGVVVVFFTATDPAHVFLGLSIFPNPAEEVLHVKLPNQSSLVALQITDVNGRVVYERKAVTGDELSIDVPCYKSGVYLLVLRTCADSKVVKRKVVVR